ncbi:MAG: hypothetical protein K2X47_16385 [Bdellovibrionales bacterium]|nr:hypothetical protein [Bdellovibrionales bacterium]
MGQLKVKKEPKGTSMYFELRGQIDEDVSFADLTADGASQVILDLEGVTSVNSCGIREWVKWLKSFPAGTKCVYVNCPKLVVDQMNMVAGFFPKGSTVESFYVPYYCESCSNETLIPFTNGKDFTGKAVTAPESVKCASCGQDAEIDVIEAKYFKFLENQG